MTKLESTIADAVPTLPDSVRVDPLGLLVCALELAMEATAQALADVKVHRPAYVVYPWEEPARDWSDRQRRRLESLAALRAFLEEYQEEGLVEVILPHC